MMITEQCDPNEDIRYQYHIRESEMILRAIICSVSLIRSVLQMKMLFRRGSSEGPRVRSDQPQIWPVKLTAPDDFAVHRLLTVCL